MVTGMPTQRKNPLQTTYVGPTQPKPTGMAAARPNPTDELKQAYAARRASTIGQFTPDTIGRELQTIKGELSKPQTAFNYDVNTDPAYQAALRQAQANSQRAAGDIAADMNKRGLLNSTITADRGNQAAQREYGYVSDTLVPQMMNQAYERYAMDQANRRQGILDQLGVIGQQYGMYQDADARSFRDTSYADSRSDVKYAQDYQSKQDRLALANYLSERYGTNVDPKMDTNLVYDQVRGLTPRNVLESDRNYNRGVLESDRNFNRGVLESDRSYGLQGANLALQRQQEGRIAGSQSRDELYRIWEATGRAPAGIPGVEPGTPLYDQVGARQGGNNGEAEPYNKMMSEALSAAQKEPMWASMSPEERQKTIEYYANLLAPQQPSGMSDSDILQYLK